MTLRPSYSSLARGTVLEFSIAVLTILMNREGGFSVSGEDVIEEIDIFEGNENRLTFEEVFQTLTVQMKIVSGVHKDLQVHLPAADVPFRQPGDRCGWNLEEHV